MDFMNILSNEIWRKFTAEKEVVGIPAEEFENVIMTYLPVTKEELKEWAVYDEQSNMFIWERLGCGNYSPTHFWLVFTGSNRSQEQ